MRTLRWSFAGATERVRVRGVSTRGATVTFSYRSAGALRPIPVEPSEEKLAEGPTHVGVRRSLAYWNQEFQRVHSPILRYGFSVVSVAIALGVAFALQYYQFREVELPLLTVAIALTTWYAGAGPSVLAVLLSMACFDYFFTEPLYSFNIAPRDLP
jgi:hypothetical protein